MQLFFRSRLPVILQAEAAECGLACLCMVASYWGKELDLPTLRKRFPASLQGATLNDLVRISKGLDLTPQALKGEMAALKNVTLPAVLHWNFNHFVVLKSIGKNFVIIHDPAVGERKISLNELSESFTGVVLELRPGAGFKAEKEKTQIRLSQFFKKIEGLTIPLLQILGFSLVVEFIAIVTPFFTQIAIDQVIPTSDKDLLKVLALGFSIVYLLGPVLRWLRQRLIVYVSTQFSAQLMINVVRFLFSLPLPYFEKRSIGDLLTRMGATEEIRSLLTEGLVIVVIDAVLSVATLIMMYYYSPFLTFIVLIATVLFILLRVAYIPHFKRLVNETLQKRGHEQSELIENLHGIMSIKFAQREIEREAIWNRHFTSFVNTTAYFQASQANYQLIFSIIKNVSMLILVYFGVLLVVDADAVFTLGAFFAFATYRDMFFSSTGNLLDQLIKFSMARVHLERLSEILSVEPETEPSEYFQIERNDLSIGISNLGFKFDPEQAFVFSDVNAQISKSDRIVILGPSGTGKTTLLKVISGVYPATTGEIMLNDVNVAPVGLRYLRSNVSAVLQSDYLFKGSIIDNISFFDRVTNFELATQCARLACIHDEIMSLPMSYETLIGEMGSSLSQGQQQRILIARALYQQKPLLILDEGTAHLDEENEARVLANIRSVGMTLIMTAHKRTLTSHATQVWEFGRDRKIAISEN